MQLDLRRHVKSQLSIQNLSLSCIMTMIKRMFLFFWRKDLLKYHHIISVLKIIFKVRCLAIHLFTIDNDFSQSSWLRDALSELDPSCERLTFIGNPPPSIPHQNASAANENTDVKPRPIRHAIMKPMLRIQATGTFGTTEVWRFNIHLFLLSQKLIKKSH